MPTTDNATMEIAKRMMASRDIEATIEQLIKRHGEQTVREPLRRWASTVADGRKRNRARRIVAQYFPRKARTRNKPLLVCEKDRVALCVRHVAQQGDKVEIIERRDSRGPFIELRAAKGN